MSETQLLCHDVR